MIENSPERGPVQNRSYAATSRHDSVSSEAYISAPRLEGQRQPKSPKGQRVLGDAARFSLAFGKAIFHRVQFLGRRLSTSEFRRLVKAVRKQITRRFFSPLESVLNELSHRIQRLEAACPNDALALQDAIVMYSSQVAVLREQSLRAISERDELSETCTHFSKRKKWSRSTQEYPTFSTTIPSLGLLVIYPPREVETLACPSCVQKREEALFYWTGTSLSTFKDVITQGQESLLPNLGLRSVSPLSIQAVWSSILDLKYGREFESPT